MLVIANDKSSSKPYSFCMPYILVAIAKSSYFVSTVTCHRLLLIYKTRLTRMSSRMNMQSIGLETFTLENMRQFLSDKNNIIYKNEIIISLQD